MTTVAPERTTTPETQTSAGKPPGEHAHYAKTDSIRNAQVTGGLIVALCGYEFEPSRNPAAFPVCPTCVELRDLAEDLA